MIRDKVHDQFHVTGMKFRYQFFCVVQRAELLHNVPVIRNVIPVVVVRAFIAGTEPDGVDAEFFQIIQARNDAGKIADAVSVGIQKTARVDLIDHPMQHLFLLVRIRSHLFPFPPCQQPSGLAADLPASRPVDSAI